MSIGHSSVGSTSLFKSRPRSTLSSQQTFEPSQCRQRNSYWLSDPLGPKGCLSYTPYSPLARMVHRLRTRSEPSPETLQASRLKLLLLQVPSYSQVSSFESPSSCFLSFIRTGRFDNLQNISAALEGCYGTFVNTDTFTVGEAKEIWSGIKIFEESHRSSSMRHFIWSGLDYGTIVNECFFCTCICHLNVYLAS